MTTDLDQLPPHNLEAEQAFIGSLLLDREAIVAVAGWMDPDAFYHAANGVLYRAIRGLWQARYPADLVTLTDFLVKRGLMEQAGGHAYLASLLTAAPTAVHVAYYGEIVMAHARRRAVIDAAADVVRRGYAGDVALDDLVGALRRAGDRFALPSESTDDLPSVMDAHRAKTVDRWEGRLTETIVPTGIASVDHRLFGGLRPGELVYIGGRPGGGKTSLALQIATAAARAGHRALLVELEMRRDAILNRLIAQEAGVPFAIAYQTIGDPWHRDDWLSASERIETLPLALEDGLATTDRIAAFCERAQTEQPVGLVLIDHLDYLADPDLTRLTVEQRTAETSKRLRRLATGLNVPVVCLVQLSRAVESAPPYKPALTHFRYSGAIEQDADYAFLLYRRFYYVEKGLLEVSPDEDYLAPGSRAHKVELLLAKNRNGQVGPIELGWLPEQMRFVEREAA